MIVSENTLKWIMRFYPPLFFQRIWVVKFEPGFKGVVVRIYKSIFNKNYNRSVFGGTIFSSVDPFYPVLLHQVFSAKGYKPIVWLKSCNVQYIKPARTNITFKLRITDDDIQKTETSLLDIGKHVISFNAELMDANDVLCASLICEVYIRDLNFRDKSSTLTT